VTATGLDEDVERMVKQTFLQEADDLLSTAEEGFLSLERDPKDPEVVAKIFRVAHTFKGSALSVGFQGIGRFSHWLEAVLDLVRKGEALVDKDIMNALLRGLDFLKEEITRLKTDIDSGKLAESDADFLRDLFEERKSGGVPRGDAKGKIQTPEKSDKSVSEKASKGLAGESGARALGPTGTELSEAVLHLANLRKSERELKVERVVGHEDRPLYSFLSSQSLAIPMEAEEIAFHARLYLEHEKRQTEGERYQDFSQMSLDILALYPRYASVGRVCIVRWVGFSRRLEVVDSACASGIVVNTMPKGYGCYVRNDSSLLALDADNHRSFSDSNKILQSFRDAGALPQRSFRRLHLAGLRSGLCFPLRVSGRVAGYLLLNSTELGAFDGLALGEVQALLSLRRVAETFLLQEAALPDADYRAAFRGKSSLPHALFNKSTFYEALARAVERVFQSPIEVNVVVAQGFRFLHCEENTAFAIARVLMGYVGLAHPPHRISVRVTDEPLNVVFAVEVDRAEDMAVESAVALTTNAPLEAQAAMCGFHLTATTMGFSLRTELEEPEGGLDYSC
jgi:hypothetical protein